MQLSSMDANLLVVLDALLETRSVSAAAARIGLSPSATSHALARLRDLFGDELLVRAGQKMVPTPRAEAVQPRLRAILSDVETLLVGDGEAEGSTLKRTFRILTSDYVEGLLLVDLSDRLTASAPGVTLRSEHVPTEKTDWLRTGHADLAIARWRDAPDDMQQRALFDDRLVTVLRRGHPALKGREKGSPLELKTFTDLDHVLIAPQGSGRGIVDEHLAVLGGQRRVVRYVSTFVTAPAMVAGSDLVVTMSLRLARRLEEHLPIVVVEPPPELALVPYTITMYWHRRFEADGGHRWLRRHLVEAGRSLPPLEALESRRGRGKAGGRAKRAPRVGA